MAYIPYTVQMCLGICLLFSTHNMMGSLSYLQLLGGRMSIECIAGRQYVCWPPYGLAPHHTLEYLLAEGVQELALLRQV